MLLDTLEHAGHTYAIHSRILATMAELAVYRRKLLFHRSRVGKTVRGIFYSLVASEEERAAAKSAGIDLRILDAPKLTPSTSFDSLCASTPPPLDTSWPSPVTAALHSPMGATMQLSSNLVVVAAAPEVMSWRTLLLAAELPEAVATEYANTLVANALELDQATDLNRELCQKLGFKLGHALKLLTYIAAQKAVK